MDSAGDEVRREAAEKVVRPAMSRRIAAVEGLLAALRAGSIEPVNPDLVKPTKLLDTNYNQGTLPHHFELQNHMQARLDRKSVV